MTETIDGRGICLWCDTEFPTEKDCRVHQLACPRRPAGLTDAEIKHILTAT